VSGGRQNPEVIRHGTLAVPEGETADPSAALRSGRDDKVEAGVAPKHWWRVDVPACKDCTYVP
jgi:hypothetical protein